MNFRFHEREVIWTGTLTQMGKKDITTELIKRMSKYERQATNTVY